MCTGALLWAAPIPRRWPARLGSAGLVAGVLLVIQSVGLLVYEGATARSHELPRGVVHLLYAVIRLLGMDAALDGTSVAVHSMRRVHELGATWELMLDPATWCFLTGGIVLVHLRARAGACAGGAASLRALVTLVALVALWLPVRAGLFVAAFTHRALCTGYDAPLVLMDQFWNPWVHLLALFGPVLLALRFVRLPGVTQEGHASPGHTLRTAIRPLVLICTGTILAVGGTLWAPAGPRRQGRILVDEHHSTWEPTGRPYDTDWYGPESGYNYACIYDYCSRFYQMDRLTTSISEHTLDRCDVLVVKVPTSPYATPEIDVVERFVERGGSLLLIGEHTNVFNTGLHLNAIARRFGFRFRYDCLFDIDTPFHQLYRPPRVPHPIVQNLPPLDFAVSCSIAPGWSPGRAVMRGIGLWSLPADYHASNFYPQVEAGAQSRYGAFVQLWATQHGAGRVAAFADSTIFSNFSVGEPGKAALMLGMLEWLNHRGLSPWVRPSVIGLGLLGVAGGLWAGRRRRESCLLPLSAALLGWCVAVVAVPAIHHVTYPRPQPVRPFTRVVIDRTVCRGPLSTSGFIAGDPNGFGIFERWMLRLGWFTSRREGDRVFEDDILVFLYPNGPVSRDFRTSLSRYVASGGRVLILDSPANRDSTANALLHPFGLRVEPARPLGGTLAVPGGWPSTTVDQACEIQGGHGLLRLGDTSVAATVDYGRGRVMAVGCGARFSDPRMGVTGDVVPNEELRAVFDLEFRLLEFLGSPVGPSPAADGNEP
jgi:hypothetical protein